MRFLFDSDTLITAKRIHYQPAFCPEFWEWIRVGFLSEVFFSIDKVKQELMAGDATDPLRLWVKQSALDGFFLDSKGSIAKWAELSSWANDPKKEFIEAAKTKFLNVDSADAWLISVAAQAGDFTIITNETSAPESKRDIKLPDAAAALNVKTVKLHEVLSTHAKPGFEFVA